MRKYLSTLIRKRCFSSITNPKKTALYDFHIANNGKMVEFAEYFLPVQYPVGVKTEHLAVRNECGLFDVSHMGQVSIHGSNREEFIHRLTPVSLDALKDNQASLSVLMNAEGGILDDTVITKRSERVDLVINGACKQKDLEHMETLRSSEFSSKDVKIVHHENKALLALQGPQAAKILSNLISNDLTGLGFMEALPDSVSVKGSSLKVDVTRCGYTGEDGFELSCDNVDAPEIAQLLKDSSAGKVTLCGLGARDSLRLEAGLCLYGNDLDASKSVVEATLLWVVHKSRRNFDTNETNFLGWQRVRDEIQTKPPLKRAGLLINGGKPIRQGTELFCTESGESIGTVTSGTFSVLLQKPIAMGYIKRSLKLGSKLFAISGPNKKRVEVEVFKMPFVPSNYFRL